MGWVEVNKGEDVKYLNGPVQWRVWKRYEEVYASRVEWVEKSLRRDKSFIFLGN